jgi:hypothetical protein
MSSRMRSRELRLGRSLQGILLSALASPFVGAAACSTSPSASAPDAGQGPDAAAESPDATVSASDAGVKDATADRPLAHDASTADPPACNSIPFDGAMIEGSQDGCVTYRALPCGLPVTASREGCFIDLATCLATCDCDPSEGGFFIYCQLSSVSCDDAGNVNDAQSIVEFVSCNGISGRRPRGLAPAYVPKRTPLGDYFAANAHLESASVRAFRELARSLDALGAPRRLVSAAHRSAVEERCHARATGRLARRFGGVTSRPRARRVPAPSLVELLEDDAVEGCVKETFGALLATWQAAHATDPSVRRTMRRIALDETRHAALAWEILGWGMSRVTREERRHVELTLDRAAVALEAFTPTPLHSSVHDVAGHPASEHERWLAREIVRLVRSLVRDEATLASAS